MQFDQQNQAAAKSIDVTVVYNKTLTRMERQGNEDNNERQETEVAYLRQLNNNLVDVLAQKQQAINGFQKIISQQQKTISKQHSTIEKKDDVIAGYRDRIDRLNDMIYGHVLVDKGPELMAQKLSGDKKNKVANVSDNIKGKLKEAILILQKRKNDNKRVKNLPQQDHLRHQDGYMRKGNTKALAMGDQRVQLRFRDFIRGSKSKNNTVRTKSLDLIQKIGRIEKVQVYSDRKIIVNQDSLPSDSNGSLFESLRQVTSTSERQLPINDDCSSDSEPLRLSLSGPIRSLGRAIDRKLRRQ